MAAGQAVKPTCLVAEARSTGVAGDPGRLLAATSLRRRACDEYVVTATTGRSAAAQVGELRVPLEERQLDRAGRPVAVLGEDQLGDALRVRLLAVVVLVAVDEHHEVGVLLDRARLAEVGEHRPLVVALLDGAGELRQGDDRHVELARQHLEPREICETSWTRFSAVPPGGHQLEVVDDDQPELRLARFRRRALARISIIVIEPVSST